MFESVSDIIERKISGEDNKKQKDDLENDPGEESSDPI